MEVDNQFSTSSTMPKRKQTPQFQAYYSALPIATQLVAAKSRTASKQSGGESLVKLCVPCSLMPFWQLALLHLAGIGGTGLWWSVAFSSWDSGESRMIAAAYDRRDSILQPCKGRLGKICNTRTGGLVLAPKAPCCYAGNLPRCALPKPQLHRAG